jgi:hypothetical protein
MRKSLGLIGVLLNWVSEIRFTVDGVAAVKRGFRGNLPLCLARTPLYKA